MSYSEIPTLTDFQVKNLTLAANNQIPAFLILDSIETDDAETKEKLRSWAIDANALELLGLTQDITENFKKEEQAIHDSYGRTFKAYALTEVGFLMFHNFGERVAN